MSPTFNQENLSLTPSQGSVQLKPLSALPNTTSAKLQVAAAATAATTTPPESLASKPGFDSTIVASSQESISSHALTPAARDNPTIAVTSESQSLDDRAQRSKPGNYQARLRFEQRIRDHPAVTPRTGQFWGHDERTIEGDPWLPGDKARYHGKSNARGGRGGTHGKGRGRGRGRGGAAFVSSRSADAQIPQDAGHDSSLASATDATDPPACNVAPESQAWSPPNLHHLHRRSQMAGWDEDESDVDDDAIHGKPVKKVPASARPAPKPLSMAPAASKAARPTFDMTGVPKAPRAHREAELTRNLRQQQQQQARAASSPAGSNSFNDYKLTALDDNDSVTEQYRAWQMPGLARSSKVGEWKAGLAESQESPSLPPVQPESSADLSSIHTKSNSTDASDSGGNRAPISDQSRAAHAHLPGASEQRWAHDRFEALQKAGVSGRGKRSGHPFGRGRGIPGVSVRGSRGRGATTLGRGGSSSVKLAAPSTLIGTQQASVSSTSSDAQVVQSERSGRDMASDADAVLSSQVKSLSLSRAKASTPVRVRLPKSRKLTGLMKEASDRNGQRSVDERATGAGEGGPKFLEPGLTEDRPSSEPMSATSSSLASSSAPGSLVEIASSNSKADCTASRPGSVSIPASAASVPAFEPSSATNARVRQAPMAEGEPMMAQADALNMLDHTSMSYYDTGMGSGGMMAPMFFVPGYEHGGWPTMHTQPMLYVPEFMVGEGPGYDPYLVPDIQRLGYEGKPMVHPAQFSGDGGLLHEYAFYAGPPPPGRYGWE